MARATLEELEALRSLGRKIAGVTECPWEPACVARAFGTRRRGEVALTMQGWFDLSRAKSPLLEGEYPEGPEEIEAAFAAFPELEWRDLEPEEIVDALGGLLRACGEAWEAALGMSPPKGDNSGGNDGFGDALLTLAFLIAQCQMDEERALAMEVRRVFMLMSAHRCNQGWTVSGKAYALRDMGAEVRPGDEDEDEENEEEGTGTEGAAP